MPPAPPSFEQSLREKVLIPAFPFGTIGTLPFRPFPCLFPKRSPCPAPLPDFRADLSQTGLPLRALPLHARASPECLSSCVVPPSTVDNVSSAGEKGRPPSSGSFFHLQEMNPTTAKMIRDLGSAQALRKLGDACMLLSMCSA